MHAGSRRAWSTQRVLPCCIGGAGGQIDRTGRGRGSTGDRCRRRRAGRRRGGCGRGSANGCRWRGRGARRAKSLSGGARSTAARGEQHQYNHGADALQNSADFHCGAQIFPRLAAPPLGKPGRPGWGPLSLPKAVARRPASAVTWCRSTPSAPCRPRAPPIDRCICSWGGCGPSATFRSLPDCRQTTGGRGKSTGPFACSPPC